MIARPKRLHDIIGQSLIKPQVLMHLAVAQAENKAFPHMLFHGGAGGGKTTFARTIAHEMGVEFRELTSGSLEKPGDLAAQVATMGGREILFIDEVHALGASKRKEVAEMLYVVMEDSQLTIVPRVQRDESLLDIIQSGNHKDRKAITIPLPSFTILGATTSIGMVPKPLLDRFQVTLQLQDYTIDELTEITLGMAIGEGFPVEEDAAREIARRSRGVPRIAGSYLANIITLAKHSGAAAVNRYTVAFYMEQLNRVDVNGLTQDDRRVLRLLKSRNNENRGIGEKSIAASLGLPLETVTAHIEPYLLQLGFIDRSPLGRLITGDGLRYIVEADKAGFDIIPSEAPMMDLQKAGACAITFEAEPVMVAASGAEEDLIPGIDY